MSRGSIRAQRQSLILKPLNRLIGHGTAHIFVQDMMMVTAAKKQNSSWGFQKGDMQIF